MNSSIKTSAECSRNGVSIPDSGDKNNNDGYGHGTHVASLAAGAHVGAAPSANIIAVKALGDNGSGSFSNIIKALDLIVEEKIKKPSKRMIASMSISGVVYKPANDAVTRAAAAGVPVVVAAGNEHSDACNFSPGSASSAITVGATNKDGNFEQSYSNYGSCVDILAPGGGIIGACADGTGSCGSGSGSTGKYTTKTGTSMATPHVAGLLALYMGQARYPGASKSPDTALLKRVLKCTATSDLMNKVPTKDTPNWLIYAPEESFDKATTLCIK